MATIEIIDGITSKDIILDEETMMMRVSSGGIAIRTTVNRNGQLTILDGGVASNTTVKRNGTLELLGSAKITGKTTFEEGAVASAHFDPNIMNGNTIIDFNLTETAPDADPLINNLAAIKAIIAARVTITVDGTQEDGYDDGDSGWNNGPLLVKSGKDKVANTEEIAKFLPVTIAASGTQDVVFDNNEIAAAGANSIDGGWKNYVGFGDAADYVKLNMTQPAKLNFTINSTGKVKVVVYKVTQDSKGKWVQTAVKTLAVAVSKKEKNSYATRSTGGILLSRLASGAEGTGYYVSVQSADAKSGGQAWYNVSVSSTVFASDFGANNKLFTDKKSKVFNEELKSSPIEADGKSNLLTMETESLIVKQAGAEAFNSFIGYGDTVDYAQVEFKDAGVCTFTVDTWGTAKGTAKFTLYKLTQKSDGSWKKKSLGTISVKNSGKSGYGTASNKKAIRITEASGEKVKYYVVMEASNSTSKKGEMYYNVTASLPLSSELAALTMPETDSLAQSDALSFDGYDTSSLASTSASSSSLAEMDDKSAWQNLSMLA